MGLFAPLSLLLVGAFLWRTATGPRWAAVTLALAGVLFGAGRPTGTVPLVLAADVAMVVVFSGLGLWMLRARRTVADHVPAGPLPA